MDLLTLTCIVVIISGLLWMAAFYYAYSNKDRFEKIMDEIEKFLKGGF